MVMNDLKTGIHHNETDNLEYFTTAYFHTTKEITAEIGEAGLKFEKLIPVEGLGWIVRNFSEKEKNTSYMKKLLEMIRMLEGNEDLTAMSPHIIALARKD